MIYKEFLTVCRKTFSDASNVAIKSALRIAYDLLKGKVRYDNTPLILHSVEVAMIVIKEIGLGKNSTVATILHDVYRLKLVDREVIRSEFGDKCVELLDGMNNISQVDPKTSTLQVDNFKELIVSYSTDPRVLLIKIADRLEVMRSLDMFPAQKQTKKSWETLNLYAPIAHKLGLYSIKSQMEDLSLKHLEPQDYKLIVRKLAESEAERLAFIEVFKKPIVERLDSLGIKYKLKSRTKSVYSIWRKMKKQKVDFEGVYDIFAIRIVIDSEVEKEKMHCWTVFSVVTDLYTSNTERMRDWISIPKSNGYESLHATVVTKQGRWVEVQIRTERMDEVAEKGVAAHWRYKGEKGANTDSWLDRLRSVVETSSDGIKEEFDFSITSGEIFVFTPMGDIKKLPQGATLLDFAFEIHTNIGSKCVGGKVNGKSVPIKEKLNSGDIVEIITSKGQRPKADWVNYVITNRAKSKIKAILREDVAQAANLGREELERKIKNWKLNIQLEQAVNFLTKRFKVKTGNEVYAIIASGEVSMLEIKDLLISFINKEITATIPAPRNDKSKSDELKGKDDDALIVDQNIKGMAYKMGKCCNPIFGDDIFAFVTIHTGITVHRSDCPNALRLTQQYPYRVMDAKWRKSVGSNFLCNIGIVANDRQGLANDVMDVVGKQLKINIRNINFITVSGSVEGKLSIEVGSVGQIDMIIAHLKRIQGVLKVFRV